MGLFSEWLKQEQGIEDPVGLEAAKVRVLGEKKEVGKLSDLTDTQKRNAKKKIDIAVGLGRPDNNDDLPQTRKQTGADGAAVADQLNKKFPTIGKDVVATHNPDNDQSDSISQEPKPRLNLSLNDEVEEEMPSTHPMDIGSNDDVTPKMMDGLRERATEIRSSLTPRFEEMSQLFDEGQELDNERWGPARQMISQMQETMDAETDPKKKANLAAQRANFALQMLMGETFSGKDRSGLSRTLSKEEAEQINKFAGPLTEAFGSGSREDIEKFVKSRKLYDTPIETARAFLKSAPKELLKTLKTSSGLYSKGAQKYFDPETGKEVDVPDAKKLHYGGPDGERGSQNSKDRMEWLMKTMLDQGMVDPYTGLPLNFGWMELDHVTDKMSPEDGPDVNPDGLPRLGSEEYRDAPENWLWSSTSTNNVKNNYGFDFLVKRAQEMTSDEGTQFPDRFLQEAARDSVGDRRDQLFKMMLSDGALGENVTPEMIDHLVSSEQSIVDVFNENSDSPMENKAIKRLMQSLGAVTDQTQSRKAEVMKPGEVTPSNQLMLPTQMHRPLINLLVGKSPEEQKEILQKWGDSSTNARDSMADRSVDDPSSWTDDPFTSTDKKGDYNRNGTYQNYLYKNLMDNGLMDMEDIKKQFNPRQMKALMKILTPLGLMGDES